MNVYIVADGGEQTGLGHIIRTSSLVQEYEKKQYSVVYLIKKNDKVIKYLNSAELKYLICDSNEGYIGFINDQVNSDDILFIDSYELSDTELQVISSNCRLSVCIDDNAQRQYNCDFIVNGNGHAPDLIFETSSKTKCLLGYNYLLLRDQFQISKVEFSPLIRTMLVTLGGADINGYTIRVLKALHKFNGKIHCVIGPGFKESTIQSIVEIASSDKRIELIINPENIAEVMKNADAAISAGGSSLYELVSMRIPTVTILQAENQRNIVNHLDHYGVVKYIGDFDVLSENELINELEMFIKSRELRKRMYENATRLDLGSGAMNVVKVITDYLKEV